MKVTHIKIQTKNTLTFRIGLKERYYERRSRLTRYNMIRLQVISKNSVILKVYTDLTSTLDSQKIIKAFIAKTYK
jgi:hypothetical protein